MRFSSRNGVLWALSACASWVTLGCEAEVGDRYTGDVMLELHGRVVAPPDESSDLVPAFAFFTAGTPGGKDDLGAAVKVELVDGRLEGVFPSDFRLRLAGPPPMGPEQAGMALGYVVLVPRDHPTSFELPSHKSVELTSFDLNDENAFTEHRQYCMSSGKCLERDYSCVNQPCEIISEAGSPESPEAGITFGDAVCVMDVCYSATSKCSDDQSCYRRAVRCDVSAPGAEQYGDDKVKNCRKTAESGDTSIKQLDEYALIASNLWVVYAGSEKSPGASLLGIEGLKPGYNLIELSGAQSDQAFIDYASCRFDAHVDALAELNEANGTHYLYDDAELDMQAVLARFSELTRGRCPAFELIADPAATAVDLNLSHGLPAR